jgi:hypothetical protein
VFGGTGELVERGISLIVVDRASALVMQLMGLAGPFTKSDIEAVPLIQVMAETPTLGGVRNGADILVEFLL